MMKFLVSIIFTCLGCQSIDAKTINDTIGIKTSENKYIDYQNQQIRTANDLCRLKEKLKESERKIQALNGKTYSQNAAIDSLRNTCKRLEETLSVDRKNVNGMIDKTNSHVQANQDSLQSRTLLVCIIAVLLLVIIVGVAYRLTKRIKSGNTSIDEVRRAQEALQIAQGKMQEESVKLDNQLLAIVQKQLDASASSASKMTGEPDHSLVVKLADEIARIETNLSKMDKSVRGYKQLVQAKDRMINNVRANGYEIISLLGQEYNDGMQFQTRFVPDESLPEGKRIITGMIKMQVNYNGKMIQPAEIVVSQNI